MEVHILPKEMFGFSTFGVAMALLKWLPLGLVDKFLLLIANFTVGNTDRAVVSSQKKVCPKQHFPRVGRERMDCIRLASQEDAYVALHQSPLKLPVTLLINGKQSTIARVCNSHNVLITKIAIIKLLE
ncbi:hypothetical protein ACSBR1_037576 [Camellia fascicularis]